MVTSQQKTGSAHFDVENIGGIDSTSLSLPPGVTVLTGENATNRTSFLQSIMAGLGSRQATLKGDADEGSVELSIAGQTYRRTLQRTGDSVQFEGEQYLDEPAVADLFAFLLENNEARQAVARVEDLRELIMRPVDTEQIRSDIDELERQKDELDEKIADIEREREKLAELEAEKSQLRDEISEKRDELAAQEEQIDDKSRDLEESKDEKEALESKLDELREVRSELETVRGQLEKQKESLSSSKRERAELHDELDEIATAPTDESQELEAEIQELRERRKRLSSEASDLQNLIQYNEEQLEQNSAELLRSADGSRDDSSVTGRLLETDSEGTVCWTCGSDVQRSQIEETIERLQEVHSRKMDELNEVKSRLEPLKSTLRENERLQDRRDEIARRIERLESEIERREGEIASLTERRTELTERVETLEAAVEEMESDDFEAVLSLHREANQLEFEIDRLESEKADIEQRIEAIEQSVSDLESLKRERDEVANELTDLRTKIDQFETEAVASINEHMEAILDILDYDNIERIWIERREQTVREGRRKVDRTRFDLHIVRTTDNGTGYEDTIDHLSESEREVTGLIFALSGYLVHDLHETVPFMLLDSLEAIDSNRIAALVDYFSEYVEFLVVALLEEDAQALDSEYNRIRDI
ncbi:archaea-specific SMC-related protein [Haloarcula sediminis]|uniref:archaea-specific SMC-related protein n=1 Tax=Haloarcula sediminis TaxID=3111777 RepID=UPI002D797DBA|nr:archaea-specific SMC-related protein [Haloarcula sp. CK38]